ncbi:unnamed protein product [Plutella xylostella]|uniref:Sulfhydryl oxidase n=1 Tax=Plutella xylostella TaxID=51655 RepID=A0A8S4GDZ0_PLUXY|nr:unnamed protein product [Plutella xylostella]
MTCLLLFAQSLAVSILLVAGAAIDNGDPDEQGLYSKADQVTILTNQNFDNHVYGQNHALLVQFYNSYCGHCRAFSPKFKTLAQDIRFWKNVIQLAVIDCSVFENGETCRNFEVTAYPSLRYMHPHYVKENSNLGEPMRQAETADKLKEVIVNKLISEQGIGNLRNVPPLNILPYSSYEMALRDVSEDVTNTFLVFENENSTMGPELILDTNDYLHIRVKRVLDISELAQKSGAKQFPTLVALKNAVDIIPITPKVVTRRNLLKAINNYLKSENYVFPDRQGDTGDSPTDEHADNNISTADTVFYSDLEKTIQTILHSEVPRYKTLTGEPLQAILNFLTIMIEIFPFRGNGREFFVELHDILSKHQVWSGNDVADLITTLESKHYPVYVSNLEYVACRGSQAKYRGYSCGLWTLFHTLTVNAAQQPGTKGPQVLRAMHGYIKNFFGCTECSEHFQTMAAKNQIFDVKENDKAVLWLWVSHNEVNLRLAGDLTEDPYHPKIQFPSPTKCPKCRQARGQWNLSAVYEYLQQIYGAANIQSQHSNAAQRGPSLFSNLDIGMLSLLYILSFAILILVVKFLTKGFYRKRIHKHDGWGKV